MALEEYFSKPVIEKISTNFYKDENRLDAHFVEKDYDVAIFGVEECINSVENRSCEDAPDIIRKQLYALQGNFKKLNICDLGNVKGNTAKDTYAAVKDIVSELAEKNIVSIILGGSQDFTLPIFNGLKTHQPKVNVTIVDNKIDLGKDDNDFHSHSFVSHLLNEKQLRRLEILAYQSYFVPESQLDFLKKHNQYAVRLGIMRASIGQIEPIIRDADLLSFDMSAIKQSDSPAYLYANPNGLTAQEACQLSLFAGYSDRIKTFGVFEMNPDFDRNHQSAALAAQMVWHFLEGLNNRQKDYPVKDIETYEKYIIHQDQLDQNIVFYENPVNNRWWIKIPNALGEKEIYACSRYEYEEAKSGRIPDSWVRYYKK